MTINKSPLLVLALEFSNKLYACRDDFGKHGHIHFVRLTGCGGHGPVTAEPVGKESRRYPMIQGAVQLLQELNPVLWVVGK